MASTKGFKEAYPTRHRNGSSSGGVTKREKFALEIMSSLAEDGFDSSEEQAAKTAVAGADALIDELNGDGMI